MNVQKLKGMLGLALRARQAAPGMDACRIMVRSGNCGLVLLDGEAGPNTRKRAEEMCARTGTPVRTVPEGMIREATGKSNIVIGIRKGSFAETIAGCCDTEPEGETRTLHHSGS